MLAKLRSSGKVKSDKSVDKDTNVAADFSPTSYFAANIASIAATGVPAPIRQTRAAVLSIFII